MSLLAALLVVSAGVNVLLFVALVSGGDDCDHHTVTDGGGARKGAEPRAGFSDSLSEGRPGSSAPAAARPSLPGHTWPKERDE